MAPVLPLSPLQVKDYTFTAVRVQAAKNTSPTGEPSLKPTIWYQPDPANQNQWQLVLTLQLSSQDEKNPYAYAADVVIQGLVEVKDSFPPDKKEQLALVNGFSILYSAAREMLSNITSRSVHGSLALPTLSFVGLVKEAIQKNTPPKPAEPAADPEESPPQTAP